MFYVFFLRNNFGGPDDLTCTFGFNIPIATYLPFLEDTLQGTNISPKNGILKMIFLFPRWDMLIPWKICVPTFEHQLDNSVFVVADWACFQHLVCWQVLYSVVVIFSRFPFLALRLLLQVWYFCSVPHKVLLHLWQGDWIPRERYFSQTNG